MKPGQSGTSVGGKFSVGASYSAYVAEIVAEGGYNFDGTCTSYQSDPGLSDNAFNPLAGKTGAGFGAYSAIEVMGWH